MSSAESKMQTCRQSQASFQHRSLLAGHVIRSHRPVSKEAGNASDVASMSCNSAVVGARTRGDGCCVVFATIVAFKLCVAEAAWFLCPRIAKRISCSWACPSSSALCRFTGLFCAPAAGDPAEEARAFPVEVVRAHPEGMLWTVDCRSIGARRIGGEAFCNDTPPS
eukprot:5756532-Pleurochrysis_carterae.AAC.3